MCESIDYKKGVSNHLCRASFWKLGYLTLLENMLYLANTIKLLNQLLVKFEFLEDKYKSFTLWSDNKSSD